MKKKDITWKILKIIWLIIGLLIILWTAFWYVKAHIIGELGGAIASIVLFAGGIYALLIFIVISLLILITKFIIKVIVKYYQKKK